MLGVLAGGTGNVPWRRKGGRGGRKP